MSNMLLHIGIFETFCAKYKRNTKRRGSSTVVGLYAIDQTERTIGLLHREFESDLSMVETSVVSRKFFVFF